jgi:hypothetical protein
MTDNNVVNIGANKEADMKKLLVEIGTETINQTNYDAVGLSKDEKVLSIGMQNNTDQSIIIVIPDGEPDTLNIHFSKKAGPYESFYWFFLVGEEIPCKVVICSDFA